MREESTAPILARRLVKRYPDLLLAGGYLMLTLVWIQLMPSLARLDRDEGFNIMKAALVEDGYRLYAEIWSDQPPLFTHMLVGWRRVFGSGDAAARSLVAVLVFIGLASAGRIAGWISQSPRAGLLAVALLLSARSFPKLSMAVMIGLPAISVALLAVWLMIASSRWRWRPLMLLACGALFACSMQIKLFTFILAPMALYICAITPGRVAPDRRTRGNLADVAILIAGFCIITLAIAPLRDPAWQQQLIRTHMKTGLPTDDTQYDSLRSVVMRFLEDAPLMLAFFTTTILAGRENFRRIVPLLIWMATSVVVLSQANPLWGHHRVMFSIPAAIMTAIAAARAFGGENKSPSVTAASRQNKRLIATISLTIALGYGLASLIYAGARLGRGAADTMDAEVFDALKSRQAHAKWVLTDDPHIVHTAGMLVPPETAVLSLKRLQRDLTEQRLDGIRKQYQPHLLLFARHEWETTFPGMIDRMTAGYWLVLKKNKDRVRLYERAAE